MGKHKSRNERARNVVRMFTEEGKLPGKSDLADTVRRALRGALSLGETVMLNDFIAREVREAELATEPVDLCEDCGNNSLGDGDGCKDCLGYYSDKPPRIMGIPIMPGPVPIPNPFIPQVPRPVAAIKGGLAHTYEEALMADDKFIEMLRAADKRLVELDESKAKLKEDEQAPITLKFETLTVATDHNGVLLDTKTHTDYRTEAVIPSCNYLSDGLARSGLCYECPISRVCSGFDEIPF